MSGARARRRQRRAILDAKARAIKVGARVVLTLVVTAALVVLASAAAAQTIADPVMALKVEAHALRVENAQLKAALADLQAQLASAILTAERQALEQELRDTMKPAADAVFDWQKKAFVIPPKEPQK